MLVAGCGFHQVGGSDDGGGGDADLSVLSVCSGTSVRGFEPLGTASSSSTRSGLAALSDAMAAVWEAATPSGSGAPGTLYFARVDRLGAVGAPRTVGAGQNPYLFRASDRLTLFYERANTIWMQALDDSGSSSGTAVAVYNQTYDDQSFSVAWTGQEFGLFFAGAGSDHYQVYFLRVRADGSSLGTPQKVPQAGSNSIQPDVAWTGSRYALAWTDVRSGVPQVYFALFDGNGARLTDDLALTTGIRGSFPSVAAQLPAGEIVCYEQKVTDTNQEIFCTRLDGSGQVTSTRQLSQTAAPSQSPHAVTHGGRTWVLWDDDPQNSGQQYVFWQFLDASGAPILDQPKATNFDAWRVRGVSQGSVLYEIQYHQDLTTTAWTAEVVTVNCF